MQRFLITIYASIFIIAVISELFGYGLITRYRTGTMYEMIAITGAELFFVVLHALFFLVLPFLTLLTLLRRRELTFPVEHL